LLRDGTLFILLLSAPSVCRLQLTSTPRITLRASRTATR
jgi:hypothetical protein